MREVGSILPKLKMKVYKGKLLFAPKEDMSLLPNCPYCNRKLIKLMNRDLHICRRKTCPATMDGKSFIIGGQKMAQILANSYPQGNKR